MQRTEKSNSSRYLFKIISRGFTRSSTRDKTAVALNALTNVVGIELDGIVEVRDESDKDGLQIAIDLKKDADANNILNFFP